MSKIILPKEIKAEFKILFDGSSVTSIRGAARLAGVDHSVLSRHFAGGDFLTSKLAQKLIKHGFDPGDFFSCLHFPQSIQYIIQLGKIVIIDTKSSQ